MDTQNDFRIIVIDDNPAIHQDFVKILGKLSQGSDYNSTFEKLSLKIFGKKNDEKLSERFEIDTASQGQEGVEKIKIALQNGRPYSLAFVDIRMPPGWDGIETIKHIWELDKDIQVVICTAYSDYSWEETVAHLGKKDNLLILKKPFDNVSVRQLACALTKKWQLLQDARMYTSNLQQQVEDRTVSLQKSLSLLKATLESSNDGILVVSHDGRVVDFNQRMLNIWQVPRLLIENERYDKWLDHMKSLLENPDDLYSNHNVRSDQSTPTDISTIKFKDGSIFECYSKPQILNETSIGRVYNFRDVTKKSKLENELQFQATHDALTGLPNRVMLLNRLRETIKHAEQNNTYFAVMFLDLDRFKLINDSLSHAVGDELLISVSKRLQASIRPEDTLARLGGDEFVILLSNLVNEENVIPRVIELINIFQLPFNIANRHVTITASIGISLYPKDGLTSDVLLRNADSAMYAAKEDGSNTYQLYASEMNKENLAKLDQEMQLRQALNNNELILCYQPQYDLKQYKLGAVEALVRWQHPEKGLLLPIDFVPLAEETGLIVSIGEWILRKACLQNKAWQDAGLPPIRIAVNVSAQQIKQQNFVEIVKTVLEETKLKPEYLELELTENVIISSMDVINTATALKELGVTIAIDDFGTGYSSLSYLKKLPLDRLKIDGSFIKNIKTEDDDEVIIRAIISVANNLHMEVLAEGVETKNQLDFLMNQHCNEIQGFYFSKPLMAKELEKLLREPNHALKNKLTEKSTETS